MHGLNCVCDNDGLASYRFVNPTTYAIVNDPKVMNSTGVPISVVDWRHSVDYTTARFFDPTR